MPRVLIISASFPPQSNVGGLRPAVFSKYLPQYGWDPIVLTRVYPEGDPAQQLTMNIEGIPLKNNIISVTFGTLDEKKALQTSSYKNKINSFFYPDYYQPPGFIEIMINKGERCFKHRKIDAIYATSPHLGCLTIAAHLSKKFTVPWMADFRDIFEQDHAKTYRDKLLHFRLRYRRKQITKTASAVVTVSQHHANILKTRLGKQVYVLPNGYDPTLFRAKKNHQSNKFTITYMGRFLDEWQRNPRPLFKALDKLLLDKKIEPDEIEVSFFGTEPDLIKQIIQNYKCKKIVKVLPRVSYEDVPSLLQDSCVNLILTNTGRLGVLTTKVFEYLAVKRPVLSTPNDGGELAKLINDINAGAVCNDSNDIVETLESWYLEWVKTGTVNCNSDDNKILTYSREQQTEELVTILNQLCETED